jgi:hypothetical protein
MDMILTNNSFQNFYLKGFTSLTNQFQTNITFQNLVAILRDKHKMILNLENGVTSITVIHKPLLLVNSGLYHTQKIIDKSDRLKGGGFNLTTD